MTPKRSYTRLSQSPSSTLLCRGLYRNKEAASIAILPPPPPLEGMLVQRRIPGCIGGNAMKQFFLSQETTRSRKCLNSKPEFGNTLNRQASLIYLMTVG